MQLLKSLPGVGDILAILIDREVGTISRFPSASQFSSYCGTTPRVSSSGGKTHYGKMRTESNQYLKWAFIEAANAVSAHHAQRGWVNTAYSDEKGHLFRNKKPLSFSCNPLLRTMPRWLFSVKIVLSLDATPEVVHKSSRRTF
jgi:hypothetical protein